MKKKEDLQSNEIINDESLGNVSGGAWILHGVIEDDLGNPYKLNNDRKTNLQKLNAVDEQDQAAHKYYNANTMARWLGED